MSAKGTIGTSISMEGPTAIVRPIATAENVTSSSNDHSEKVNFGVVLGLHRIILPQVAKTVKALGSFVLFTMVKTD